LGRGFIEDQPEGYANWTWKHQKGTDKYVSWTAGAALELAQGQQPLEFKCKDDDVKDELIKQSL